ncbi:hypothetical protein DEW08_16775 [Azospirillum thermophilum]|uniref:Uncharacterized protein n=2 Tax=Azospirillum thermophilum TaxID=2202148 RepID=A0A2S2CTA3_9PROT|nr:hypothetical protein DEW08_16775 [Azospirillum thermophilum]
MSFAEVGKLVVLVGQGIGIGKRCSLPYRPLEIGFRELMASERYTSQQKDQLRLGYQDGEGTAILMMSDRSACTTAQGMWLNQIHTLAGALSVAK